MQISFPDKIVAVTGGGIGFGRSIAQTFSGLGARVFACDIDEANLRETGSGAAIVTAVVDLRDRQAAADWIAGIERETGRAIDILVNNAGGALKKPLKPLEEVADADWDEIFAVNMHGTMAVTRAAAPAMKRAGQGRIINISSGAGLRPSLTGVQAYTSAKHAVIGFTKQMAYELGPFGITVNSVAPGLVFTEPSKEQRFRGYTPEKQQAILESIALRRFGSPEDITNAVVFFASDMSSMVTAQVLSVSGGLS